MIEITQHALDRSLSRVNLSLSEEDLSEIEYKISQNKTQILERYNKYKTKRLVSYNGKVFELIYVSAKRKVGRKAKIITVIQEWNYTYAIEKFPRLT